MSHLLHKSCGRMSEQLPLRYAIMSACGGKAELAYLEIPSLQHESSTVQC